MSMTPKADSVNKYVYTIATGSSRQFIGSNDSRVAVSFQNEGDVDLLLQYNASASINSYSVVIRSGSYYEMPQPIYVGAVHGTWRGAYTTGSVHIVEFNDEL